MGTLRHKDGCGEQKKMRLVLLDSDLSLHRAVRDYVAGADAGWHVDAYADADAGLKSMQASPPTVALVEADLPGRAGIVCLRRLRLRWPELPIVVWSTRRDSLSVLQTMSGGTFGFLFKPLPLAELVRMLEKAVDGGLPLCGKAERLLKDELRGVGRLGENIKLTERERDVMLCLCQAMSVKDIAHRLGMAPSTVHSHKDHIFRKLGVKTSKAAAQTFSAHVGLGIML